MSRIAVLTSGGDSPGMNAGLRAVVRTGIHDGHQVIGIKNGFSGIFKEEMEEMDLSSVADIIHRGGTILGTSRSQEMETEEGADRAAEILSQNKIDHLVIFGGDGSMKGGLALGKRGINVAAVPATIDNDLGFQDASIGFFTAIETITDAIAKIRDTSSAHKRANIVEVMGRRCGDLALYAGIAGGAESIVVPERPLRVEDLIEKVQAGQKRGKRHHIILLTEDIIQPTDLAQMVEEGSGIETRVTILGYIQRGGNPSIQDRINASILGQEAVRAIEDPYRNQAIGLKNGSLRKMDLEQALGVSKEFNERLYETLKTISI